MSPESGPWADLSDSVEIEVNDNDESTIGPLSWGVTDNTLKEGGQSDAAVYVTLPALPRNRDSVSFALGLQGSDGAALPGGVALNVDSLLTSDFRARDSSGWEAEFSNVALVEDEYARFESIEDVDFVVETITQDSDWKDVSTVGDADITLKDDDYKRVSIEVRPVSEVPGNEGESILYEVELVRVPCPARASWQSSEQRTGPIRYKSVSATNHGRASRSVRFPLPNDDVVADSLEVETMPSVSVETDDPIYRNVLPAVERFTFIDDDLPEIELILTDEATLELLELQEGESAQLEIRALTYPENDAHLRVAVSIDDATRASKREPRGSRSVGFKRLVREPLCGDS